MTELWAHGARELARLVRAREVSAREPVQAHVDRLGQVHPALNAVTVVLADSALRAADDTDAALRQAALGRAEPPGPPCGVPMAAVPVAVTQPPWRPVCARRAFETGVDLDPGWLAGWPPALLMTVAVNLLGLPAVTIPVGCEDGLPQAVQVIGPRFREDMCLAAAAAIEAGTGPLTPVDPREDAGTGRG